MSSPLGSTLLREDNGTQLLRAGVQTVVHDMTVTGGGTARDNTGIAIQIAEGNDLTASGLWVEDHVGDGGHGTINVLGDLTLSDSYIRHNVVPLGSGMRVGPTGVLVATNVTFAQNRVTGTSPNSGELWLHALASVSTFNHCTFDRPDDGKVGVAANGDATVTLESTVGFGGGPSIGGFVGSPVTIDRTALEPTTNSWSALGVSNQVLDGSTPTNGDPFVRSLTGPVFLEGSHDVVDAGDTAVTTALIPDWLERTTSASGTLDTDEPDLGAHTVPGLPLLTDVSVSAGLISWTAHDVTACTLDGVEVTSPMALPGASFEMLCEGPGGALRALYTCEGDVDAGDADLDGVCD